MVEKEDYVKWFSELSSDDVSIAGGKGASLAEMYNNKFPIPPGFAVTAQAYQYFVTKTGVQKKIEKILEGLDIEDTSKLEEDTKKIRELIINAEMPEDLKEDIVEAYEVLDVNREMMKNAHKDGTAMDILRTGQGDVFVAVRSSATAEDLADASFAGQQETFLNIKGKGELIEKVKACFASLYTARATYYREKKGFEHSKTYLSVIIQKMIDSDKSGVIFSKNPVKNDESILIESVFGLGEGIVSGRIKPDNYIVDKNLEDFKILSEEISNKKIAIVRDSSGKNKIVKLTSERSEQRVLKNYEIKRLANYARELEEYYKKPQDIEFAIENNNIYIVQSRPITTLGKKINKEGKIKGEILLKGIGASPGVGSGIVKIVNSMEDLKKIKKGDVLVTEMTNPDMVVTMQKATAIVTDEGGLTSHAAIVSREMGIPAIVGTGDATKKLKEGDKITVYGGSGNIIAGEGEIKKAEINPIIANTRTKIKVIVDLPDYTERAAKTGAKSVGLTRIEGIIASSGKHPLYYLNQKDMKPYIEILYQGLKKILQPFEEVWIRTSDIRSDEYRNLEGAPKEVEGNPMLGNHGIRFGLKNPEILESEINAVKELADDFPNKKIGIMMPGVISVDELKKTKEIANKIGIPKNVKIGIMVETPSVVELINDFCEEGIDFISFGTNDLTQYILAIDRNNSDVQDLYNEMHPAVLNAIKYVIRRCKRNKIETSICGQAGSKEEMVKFLVKEKIDSISVNADAAEKISKLISQIEGGNEKEKENNETKRAKENVKFRKVGDYEIIHPHHAERILSYVKERIGDIPDKIKPKPNEEINPSMNPPETPISVKNQDVETPAPKEPETPYEPTNKKNEEDIEESILNELNEEEFDDKSDEIEKNEEDIEVVEEDKDERRDYDMSNEYNPGNSNNKEKEEIPSLNEAISVENEDITEEDGDDEVLDIF